jgi:phosphatidylethanolamine/phosphatidyl-N-methylethanolamine N-methyltransferase
MNNTKNLKIYRRWSPFYDIVLRPLSGQARRRAITALDLRPNERLLIPGIGTGLDLLYLPADIAVVGVELSPAMLAKAQKKVDGRNVTLVEGDAQQLNFPDSCFDAVLLNLLLTVVPDGAAAFQEAWRVLCPGGRMVIFDKFLPETNSLTVGRRILGGLIRAFGTDPNRRLSDIIDNTPDLVIQQDKPALLGGQYRLIQLNKLRV